MKFLILIFLFSFSVFSDSTHKWSKQEDPGKLINENYKIKFRDLPLKGQLERVPWSDTYWPTYMGGISWRWVDDKKSETDQTKYPLLSKNQLKSFDISTLSPAEKFDLLMGDENWTITNMERKRTGIITEKKIPRWYGLCHAWAPATMQYLSPKPFTLTAADGTAIPFYAADIKALLTYNLHLLGDKTTTYFMGSRCDVAIPKLLQALSFNLLTEEKYLSLIRNENCNDMDAGAFHLALATMIGFKKTGFVMDMTRGSEVWNQPVYAFQTKILNEGPPKKKRLSKRAAEDILGVDKVLTVITNIVYIGEINPNKDGSNYPKESLLDINYKYEIHLNAEGNIIGGKWLGDARPDFFWRTVDPGFHPMMLRLKELYAASTTGPFGETRRHSVGQIKGLWKQTAKNIINAKRFLKSSQELAIERKGKRIDFYSTLKDEFTKNLEAVKNLLGF